MKSMWGIGKRLGGDRLDLIRRKINSRGDAKAQRGEIIYHRGLCLMTSMR